MHRTRTHIPATKVKDQNDLNDPYGEKTHLAGYSLICHSSQLEANKLTQTDWNLKF